MQAILSWHLLPPDLIEQQISQIDLLMAMYPTEDETTLDKDSERLLNSLREGIENGMTTIGMSGKAAPTVTIILMLTVSGSEEKSLQLDIAVPFSYEGESTPEEPPKMNTRMRQPAWMNRATATRLNTQIQEIEDLISVIQAVDKAAANYLLSVKEDKNEVFTAALSLPVDAGPLVRVWFYFPSISTRSKRDDFVIYAPLYHLTGFLYAGKPGLLCVEGPSQSIDDYMKFIKTESWGDIPAYHKKVSERYREIEINRVFEDMEEITDSVGERRGQRANRGDMKAIEGWLVERGLGNAFMKVLM